MIEKKLCYLATVYSKYPKGLEAAFIEASRITAKLIRATTQINFIYSPVCHSHSIAIHGKLDPLDYKLWLPFNEKMLALSDVLLVAHMDGWQESHGINEEVKFFERAGKPIYDLNPETMLMARRKDESVERAQQSIAELDAKIAAYPHWGTCLTEWNAQRRSLQRFVEGRELKLSVTDDRADKVTSLLNQTNLAHAKTPSEQGGASV